MKPFYIFLLLLSGFLLPFEVMAYKKNPAAKGSSKATRRAVAQKNAMTGLIDRVLSSPEEEFQGTESQVSEDQTEAQSPFDDSRRSDEHCCDRDKPRGFAQEASPQENHQLIARILSRTEGGGSPPKRKGRKGGSSGGSGAGGQR